MKKHSIFTIGLSGLVFLFLVACLHEHQKKNVSANRDSFNITGQVAGMDSGWVMISHAAGDSLMTDSALVISDTFHYTGVQSEPALYVMELKGKNQSPLRLFVENAKIEIEATKDSFSAADVLGSASEEMYKRYLKQIQPVMVNIHNLNQQYEQAYKNNNKAMIQSLDKTYDSLSKAKKQLITKFVNTHNESIISAWAITRNFLYNPNAKKLSSLYNTLDSTIQKTSYGKKIKKALETAKKVAIGKTAPGFTQDDVHGNPFSLSSLRGKYVLVDFWASWCGPCRKENPNVVKAFNEYKDKGFTVLGVSLDKNKSDWVNAIKHDHLTWHQVSDLKGWNNAVAQQYGIRAIPSNFLINPQGKIIGHTLRGEELENKLNSIFN